jgi:hypothetical protein
MQHFVLSGRIVDIVLLLLALEALAVIAWRQRARRNTLAPELLGWLLSGAFLLLALRAALTDAWWGWIALFLAAAGVAHAVELARRWGDHSR